MAWLIVYLELEDDSDIAYIIISDSSESEGKQMVRFLFQLFAWFIAHLEFVFRKEFLIVWLLNAKFGPDRDKADKSAKLCIQFPWDMSFNSDMGAQGKKKLPVTV